jgi:hypothetical protein
MSINAPAAGIVPLFRTTAAAIATAQSVRSRDVIAGSQRGIAGTPTVGATISVQDLTSDPSAVATPQSTTGYYLSTDNHLDAGDILIGRRTVPALAAGGLQLGVGSSRHPGRHGARRVLPKGDRGVQREQQRERRPDHGCPVSRRSFRCARTTLPHLGKAKSIVRSEKRKSALSRIPAAAPEPLLTFLWLAAETGMRAGERAQGRSAA